MKLVDMKLPKKTKKDLKVEMVPSTMDMDQERYPYGLQLNFHKDEIEKIKILQGINAGTTVKIQAVGKVVEVRTTDAEKEKKRHDVEIQIHKIAITNDKFEESQAEKDFKAGAEEE